MLSRNLKRKNRKLRIRRKVTGSKGCPRLCVFKSSRFIYAQVIDDEGGKTYAAESDLKIKDKNRKKRAELVGIEVAKKCLNKKITSVVFDRGGYKYTGLIKILADAARKKGLKF